jgi:hypothetical protein
MSFDAEAIALELIDTAAELIAGAALVESGEIAPADIWHLCAQVSALRTDLIEETHRRRVVPSPSFDEALREAFRALVVADVAHYGRTGSFVVLELVA